jgi:hypothetical protein
VSEGESNLRSIYEVAIEILSSKFVGFTRVRLGWAVVPDELWYTDGSTLQRSHAGAVSTSSEGATMTSTASYWRVRHRLRRRSYGTTPAPRRSDSFHGTVSAFPAAGVSTTTSGGIDQRQSDDDGIVWARGFFLFLKTDF